MTLNDAVTLPRPVAVHPSDRQPVDERRQEEQRARYHRGLPTHTAYATHPTAAKTGSPTNAQTGALLGRPHKLTCTHHG
jgi:hypothetical protein